MRKSLARIGWLGLLALLVVGCQRTLVYVNTPEVPSGGAETPERQAVIMEAQGQVDARTSASAGWAEARIGQALHEGAEVRTGAGASVVIELTEGSRLYIGPDTEFSFRELNAFLDSQLTALELRQGEVWILLTGGALDVDTPYGTAAARGAYWSVALQPQQRNLTISCLQGVCGFGSTLIPAGYKLLNARANTQPEPMTMSDYGIWGVRVPEATQLAYLATEAIAQGSATLPVVATVTPRPTEPPTATPRASATPAPTGTETAAPTAAVDTPIVDTAAPPSETPAPSATALPPTNTAAPSPTQPVFRPTVTRPPFTPLPAAPIMGRHVVRPGETIFCIGRGYGVLPAAIAQANGIPSPFNVRAGVTINIPQVRWTNILSGPVCATQFVSDFPGLAVPTTTADTPPTAALPALSVSLNFNCTANCGSNEGDYVVRIEASAVGGIGPYSYAPAQTFEVTVPHCVNGSGSVTVTSTDGQSASANWFYRDVSCTAP